MTSNAHLHYGGSAVTLTFWSLVLYALLSLVGSLLRSLYGGPPVAFSADPKGYSYNWCVAQLANSQTQLESRLLYQMQRVEVAKQPGNNWVSWRATWEQELERDAALCRQAGVPALDQGFTQVRELGARFDAVNQALMEAGSAQRGVQERLRQLTGG